MLKFLGTAGSQWKFSQVKGFLDSAKSCLRGLPVLALTGCNNSGLIQLPAVSEAWGHHLNCFWKPPDSSRSLAKVAAQRKAAHPSASTNLFPRGAGGHLDSGGESQRFSSLWEQEWGIFSIARKLVTFYSERVVSGLPTPTQQFSARSPSSLLNSQTTVALEISCLSWETSSAKQFPHGHLVKTRKFLGST